MDSESKEFYMHPLSLEKEFKVLSIKKRLHELDRKELEEFLSEALLIMTKLADQVVQLKDYVDKIEGKTK